MQVELLSASTADARDWRALRTLFADQVAADYRSATGAASATIQADAFMADWTGELGCLLTDQA